MSVFDQPLNTQIALIREAIWNHKQLTCFVNGLGREFCPHILGTRHDDWRTLVWQFAGRSSHGNLPDWRCYELADIHNLAIRDGEWHRGFVLGTRDQRNIDVIDTVVDAEYAAEIRPYTSTPRISWPGSPRPGRRRRW